MAKWIPKGLISKDVALQSKCFPGIGSIESRSNNQEKCISSYCSSVLRQVETYSPPPGIQIITFNLLDVVSSLQTCQPEDLLKKAMTKLPVEMTRLTRLR
jgi:hypothetical protein